MKEILKWLQNQDIETLMNPLSLNKSGNNVHEAYKNFIPADFRMIAKSLINPTQITENNFTKKELELLKNINRQSMQRSSTPMAKQAQKDMNEIKKIPEKQQISIGINGKKQNMHPSDAAQFLKENFDPSLQYNDYPEQGLMDSRHPILSSFSSPSYSLANTIGRAIYNTDNKGNTHVKDIYNLPEIDPARMQNFVNNTSQGYKNMHEFVRKYGTPMPVDINLGQMR